MRDEGLNAQRAHTRGADRRDAVQRAIVAEILRATPTDWKVAVVDAHDTTEAELRAASLKLEEWKVVYASRTLCQVLPMALFPLDAAYLVDTIDTRLEEYFEPGRGSYTDNSVKAQFGDGNTFGGFQAAGGQNNTQHIVHVGSTEQSQILGLVREALDTLDDDAPQDLREALESIRAEAEKDEPDREGLKSRIFQGVALAVTSEVTQKALHLLGQMAAVLA